MQDDWVGEGLFVWPSWRGERCSLFQEKRDFEIAFNTRCELREAFLDTWNADIHKAMRGCGKRRIPMEASESSSVFLRVLFEDDVIFPRVSAVEVQRLAHVLTLQSRTEEASVQWKKRNANGSVVQLATSTAVAAFALSPIWDGFGTLERKGCEGRLVQT